MDFPLNLESQSWVYGLAELEQTIKMLLKNPQHMWIQSDKIGSRASVHTSNAYEVQSNVEATLQEVPGISIKEISVKLPYVEVRLEYNRREVEFQFSVA